MAEEKKVKAGEKNTEKGTEENAPIPAGTSVEENVIVFYCKECQKLIDNPVRKGKKYDYSCPECKRSRVSFGTRDAIGDFFHIKGMRKKK